MSFTLDGQTIDTRPVTIVTLDCGEMPILSGHSVQVGDWMTCEHCGDLDAQVTDLIRTEMVDIVQVD